MPHSFLSVLCRTRFIAFGGALLAPVATAAFLACGGDAGDGVATFPSQSDVDGGRSSSSGDNGDDGTFGTSEDAGKSGTGTEGSDECRKMDFVFVIDNSESMGQEQDNLAANFPKFANLINGYKTKTGETLDYRVAVTTTDIKRGKGGDFIMEPPNGAPCSVGPARRWLERTDSNVVDAFACRSKVGVNGNAVERPLGSLFLALTERITDGTNTAAGASFLREDALLAVIMLTDEDEAFSRPVQVAGVPDEVAGFAPAFDKVKGGERGRWAAAAIAGETACNSAGFGSAKEAKELKSFIKDVGKNGVFSSICAGDLTEGLTKALATFDLACKSFPPVVK